MESIVDSSLWVDYFRPKTPEVVREQVTGWIERSETVGAMPVVYEIRRLCRREQRAYVDATFSTLPILALPDDFWESAIALGRACADRGFTAGPLDLLIATLALHHDAEIVTFDADYSQIAEAETKLRVQVLARAS